VEMRKQYKKEWDFQFTLSPRVVPYRAAKNIFPPAPERCPAFTAN
jgi:hypothetical protein